MAHLNWSKLNGAEFESLVQTLLWALYPDIRAYGRPGRDSAMDALSADGIHVYQAKFIQSQKMSDAIKRAKEEAETIERYNKGNDARAERLKAVKEWTLVGTFLKNPEDETKWNAEVVPKFKAIGIEKVHFWGIEELEPRLHRIPEVRDSYFEDSNRPFLLLPEVLAKLDSENYGEFFAKMPLIGRDNESKQFIDFIIDESCRFVAIDGVEGQGKSKFLFESAIALQNQGWRVIWGMPVTMNASDNWSRSVNTSDQVCLFVEDLDDAILLQKIIDQISVREKYTWKVVITCDSSIVEPLLSLLANKKYFKRLTLHELNDSAISAIIKIWGALCERNYQVAETAKIKSLARGLPGLTCFILANLVSVTQDLRLGVSHELFDRLWDSLKSKLEDLSLEKDKCTHLLCWLGMWHFLVLGFDLNSPSEKVIFLSRWLNVEICVIISALNELVERKVIARWGTNLTYYALEPSIMRQVVVSKVLFRLNGTKWEVGEFGRGLIFVLLKERVPDSETLISTIGTFSSVYLDENKKVDFVAPILNAISELTKDGSLKSYNSVIYWLSKIGKSSPIAAIELLHKILVNTKQDEVIDDGWGGKMVLTHQAVVSRIPECLYMIAPYAVSAGCEKQCWRLMEILTGCESASGKDDQDTKSMLYYFKKLITGDVASDVYADLALQRISNELLIAKLNHISQRLVLALSEPKREINGMASPFTFVLAKRLIEPSEKAWQRVSKIRELLYEGVKKDNNELRIQSIQLLAEIHGLWDSAILLDKPRTSELLLAYIKVLEDDLKAIKSRILNPAIELEFAEANIARKVWELHLKERNPAQLYGIAQQCEDIYKRLSPFDFAGLLEWKTRKERDPELDKIFEKFKSAANEDEIASFFTDMQSFISNESRGGYDDFNVMGDIAERCDELFAIDTQAPNTYTKFIASQIESLTDSDALDFKFLYLALRKYLKRTRPQIKITEWVSNVFHFIERSPIANKLLVAIYSAMPAGVIGEISSEELNELFAGQINFRKEEKLSLLPQLLKFDEEEMERLVECEMHDLKSNQEEFDRIFSWFVYHLYLTCLKCDFSKTQIPVDWLLPYLIENYADGNLFASQNLYWLLDASGKRFGNALFARFVARRMSLEEQGAPYIGFSLEPHGIEISRIFSNDNDDSSLIDVCAMVSSRYSYVTACMLPKYIAELDPQGLTVGFYTKTYIAEHPNVSIEELVRLGNLASAYDDTREPWEKIVRPICEKLNGVFVSDKDRARVFSSFRPKTWFHSSNVGEVPEDIIDRFNTTKRILDSMSTDSVMREYWQWAYDRAKREYDAACDEAEAERHE